MRNIVLVLTFFFVGFFLLMQLPVDKKTATMPWDIIHHSDGSTSIFGLQLSHSTFAYAQRHFRAAGDIALFEENEDLRVEIYFKSVNFGGLSGKIILTLALDPAMLLSMKQHAVKMQKQPSGAIKYQLEPDDLPLLSDAPIQSIAYIPSIRLDEAALRHRFGEPDHISYSNISPDPEQADNKVSHWHYNQHGLTILHSPDSKPVLQYNLPE